MLRDQADLGVAFLAVGASPLGIIGVLGNPLAQGVTPVGTALITVDIGQWRIVGGPFLGRTQRHVDSSRWSGCGGRSRMGLRSCQGSAKAEIGRSGELR